MQFRRMGVGRHKLGETIWTTGLTAAPTSAAQGPARPDGAGAGAGRGHVGPARPPRRSGGEELGRQVALAELVQMGARMRLREAVVQMAPMLGLLGTVIGMIDAFGNLARSVSKLGPADAGRRHLDGADDDGRGPFHCAGRLFRLGMAGRAHRRRTPKHRAGGFLAAIGRIAKPQRG